MKSPAATSTKRVRTKVMARKAPKRKLVEAQKDQSVEEEGLGVEEESVL